MDNNLVVDNYKYYCENPDKQGLAAETFNADIKKALADNDVDGIKMISNEFISWLTDASIEKGNYHEDETGVRYQDRDDAYFLNEVPVDKVKIAIASLEEDPSNRSAKNTIQRVINDLFNALD